MGRLNFLLGKRAKPQNESPRWERNRRGLIS
jgi:hypothetical protein